MKSAAAVIPAFTTGNDHERSGKPTSHATHSTYTARTTHYASVHVATDWATAAAPRRPPRIAVVVIDDSATNHRT